MIVSGAQPSPEHKINVVPAMIYAPYCHIIGEVLGIEGGDTFLQAISSFRIDADIEIANRGDRMWAVKCGSSCYNRDGEWVYEPSPSNRTDEFIKATRFGLDEAFVVAGRARTAIDEEYSRHLEAKSE